MLIAVADTNIRILKVDSPSELRKILEDRASKYVMLGEGAASECYAALIQDAVTGEALCSIGICSEGHGPKPQMLPLPRSRTVLIGYDVLATGVSVDTGEIEYVIDLEAPFYSFIHLYALRIIIVLHETGMVGLTEEGEVIWSYSSDIITDCKMGDNDLIQLYFMDDPPVYINVLTGESYG